MCTKKVEGIWKRKTDGPWAPEWKQTQGRKNSRPELDGS